MDNETWCVIRTSNYDQIEGPRGDQYFVAIGIPRRELAQQMADALNNWDLEGDDRYVVVDSDYVLPTSWPP